MTTTTTYTEVAAADGAWTCPMLLPPTPFEQVRATLTAVTADSGWPIAAFLYGADADPVTELLLYRDPSRSFGTPGVLDCNIGAEALAAASGWQLAPDRTPHAGVLVGMGLREGYEPDAPQHQPDEVDQLLAEHGTGWSCRTARLVSARLVEGEVRWYDEVGAVVQASADLVPVLERIAARFAQHRFVITDLAGQRTGAFVQQAPASS